MPNKRLGIIGAPNTLLQGSGHSLRPTRDVVLQSTSHISNSHRFAYRCHVETGMTPILAAVKTLAVIGSFVG